LLQVFTIHKDFTVDMYGTTPKKVFYVDSDHDGVLYQINFWVHAVLIKLLPCFILTLISAWLIRALYRANNRKKLLKGYNVCQTTTIVNGGRKKSTKRSKAERRTDRTTKMLVAVLLLFLMTEFPQGILGKYLSPK
jgi:thyrotropin-releasing hormone receptor